MGSPRHLASLLTRESPAKKSTMPLVDPRDLTARRPNNIVVLMIPNLDDDGNLPPGVHWATWKELKARFATNSVRTAQLEGLMRAARNLKDAGCRQILVDGSFVTSKDLPGDFDAVWDPTGVDGALLDPILLLAAGRTAQKAKYGGDLFPEVSESSSGLLFSEFFQLDKQTGSPKGIVAVDLKDWQE